MTRPSGFPRTLLEQPIEERQNYFDNYTVAHEKLKAVDAALRRAISKKTARSPVILVCGPTGVGKSTLCQRVQRVLIEEMLPELQTDLGRIPVASVEAAAPDSGNFDWKDYYIRCLTELNEVLIAQKLKFGKGDDDTENEKYYIRSRDGATSLRRALEKALIHRRPAAFLVDEAQSLTRMSSGRRLMDQMECIKSLAGLTKTVHVLFGTYDLLALRNLNGQLSRRSQEIHFERYRADDNDDIRAFKTVLRTFEYHLPLQEKPNLEEEWEYMYERCLGCVGVLKDWLSRALDIALGNGGITLTRKHLEQEALSASRCEIIAMEIYEGEKKLKEEADAVPRLRSLLGLKTASGADEVETEERENSRKGNAAKKRKASPFERNPKRDPSGKKRDAA